MYKNAIKNGTAGNFELKIGTVPLKVGQLEGMQMTKEVSRR